MFRWRRSAIDHLDVLPRWAGVAFAAHCARRVQPLFAEAWPDALPCRSFAIETAIRLAEQSAEYARPAQGLKHAAVEAMCAAGVATAALYDLPAAEPVPFGENACLIASFAARAAERAATAATTEEQPQNPVVAAFAFAQDAIQRSGRSSVLIQLETDLRRLVRSAKYGQWNDDSPMAPIAFRKSDG